MVRLKQTSPPKAPRSEKLLLQVAQLHYQTRLSKTAIAKRLGVSVTQVARLLREAAKQGIVRISVTAPRQTALEEELARRFKLREVRVISASSDETALRTELGREAARVFSNLVRPGARIGIGSGRTMYELIAALPQQATAIEIFPLAVIADQSREVRSVDAMTLVTTLWFKFRPDAHALRMTLAFPGMSLEKVRSLRETLFDPAFLRDLDRSLAGADAFFFSASHPRKDSQIVTITNAIGVDVRDLREKGVVGDFLFRPVDRNGEVVDVGIEPFVLGIPLALLKRAARDHRKAVVLVAGGREKAPIVSAGLRAGYFNTLVTDDETAEILISTY